MCLFVNSNLSISLMLKSLVLWGLLVLGWSPLCYFDHGTFLKGITHQPIPVFYHRAPFLFNFSDFGLQIHVHPDWVPNKHWTIADVTQNIRKMIKKTLAKTSYKMNVKFFFCKKCNTYVLKSTVMRKSAKAFNISGWLFFSLVAKSKVPIHTSYLPH